MDRVLASIAVVVVTLLAASGPAHSLRNSFNDQNYPLNDQVASSQHISFNNSFAYFDTLEETGTPEESINKYWWLNSGARFYVKNGVGRTLLGNLPRPSLWQWRYSQSDSQDSNGGLRPQNIFRLITKVRWTNSRAEAFFSLLKYDQASDSPNRNQSNGFTLLTHYHDADNFYYGGVRVDGSAVIKKKEKKSYYEMAYRDAFWPGWTAGEAKDYLFSSRPVGLRLETTNILGDQVQLKLYANVGTSTTATSTDEWQEILSVIDNGRDFGGAALTAPGFSGIRTDFMDAQIANYQVYQRP